MDSAKNETYVLLYNLGNSEFGRLPKEDAERFREYSQERLEEFKKHRKKPNLPIFQSVLNKVEHETRKGPLTIILFATDQKIKHPKDTIIAAELIKEWCSNWKSINNVMIKEIEYNPSDYDLMLKFYEDWFDDHMVKSLQKSKRVYISLTAGTPAMSFGLVLWASRKLEDRFVPLYTPFQPPQPPQTKILRLGKSLVEKKVEDFVNIMQKKEDYLSIVQVIEQFNLRSYLVEKRALYEAKYRRSLFDFAGALEILENISEPVDDGNLREEFLKEKDELERLARIDIKKIDSPDDALLLLEELLHSILVHLKRDEFTEAIGKLYFYVDFILKVLLWKFEKIKLFNRSEVDKFSETVKDRENWEKFFERNKNDLRREPSSLVLLRFLKDETLPIVQDKEVKNRLKNLLEFLENLRSGVVEPLRHRSVYGHGFEYIDHKKLEDAGYSKEELESKLERRFEDLKEIVNTCDRETHT